MLPYFENRRSCRVFADRRVDLGLVETLLESAAHAPTTGNMQLYSVIITSDDAGRRALAPAHFNQPATQAPVLLTFCADFRRFSRWCILSGADPGYDNLQGFMTALLDTVIFAQQFVTLAEMEGLGTCYLGTTTYNAPQIAEALHLPQLVVPVTTIALGWPQGEGEDAGRLPARAYIHHGAYADPTDAEVLDLYAEKEARPDSRRFVEENGKKSLAQVFTDVRYTRQAMEHFSGVLADALRSAGFKI